MSGFASDRAAGIATIAAFAAAALLVVVALWSSAGESPEHWMRARFLVAPLALALLAGSWCGWCAWRRRADASRWLPLAAAAATALAAAAATLRGAL